MLRKRNQLLSLLLCMCLTLSSLSGFALAGEGEDLGVTYIMGESFPDDFVESFVESFDETSPPYVDDGIIYDDPVPDQTPVDTPEPQPPTPSPAMLTQPLAERGEIEVGSEARWFFQAIDALSLRYTLTHNGQHVAEGDLAADASSFAWQCQAAGDWTLTLTAVGADGQSVTQHGYVAVTSATEPLQAQLTASVAACTVGDTITFAVAPSGGAAPYQTTIRVALGGVQLIEQASDSVSIVAKPSAHTALRQPFRTRRATAFPRQSRCSVPGQICPMALYRR